MNQNSKEKLQSIHSIQDQENINATNDYENFLTPEAVYEAKMNNKLKILQITKNDKKTIWKPLKIRLGKVVRDEIDKLLSNTAQ